MKITPTYESLWGFVAAGFFALILWCFKPYDYIEVWKAGFLLFLSISSIWFAVLHRLMISETTRKELLTIEPIALTTMNNETVLLLKPNKMLFIGALVTIHQRINEIENYVATGQVTNIQSDGRIQLTIISPCTIKPEDLPTLVLMLGLSAYATENEKKRTPEH